MRPISRIVRRALPIVLMLAAPTAAFAESVCHAIWRGESAARVAWRLTGDGRNAYQTWFQIKNSSSRFVPKSQYNRIRAGWQACVPGPAVRRTSSIALHLETREAADVSELSSASASPDAYTASDAPAPLTALAAAADTIAVADPSKASVPRTIGDLDLTMLWLGAAMVVPWFGWRILDGYLVRLKTASLVMRHFADRFVTEFERPLVRYHAEDRPVRSRLRCSARRRRLEILLAPGDGRRYPNLSDHKRNLEYDVARVIQELADESFVSGPFYTQAGWVVVPLQFKVGPTRRRAFGASTEQAGVSCISSF